MAIKPPIKTILPTTGALVASQPNTSTATKEAKSASLAAADKALVEMISPEEIEKAAVTMLEGFVKGFAKGGHVKGGKLGKVGEYGPEAPPIVPMPVKKTSFAEFNAAVSKASSAAMLGKGGPSFKIKTGAYPDTPIMLHIDKDVAKMEYNVIADLGPITSLIKIGHYDLETCIAYEDVAELLDHKVQEALQDIREALVSAIMHHVTTH